jgi:hypothetical protein
VHFVSLPLTAAEQLCDKNLRSRGLRSGIGMAGPFEDIVFGNHIISLDGYVDVCLAILKHAAAPLAQYCRHLGEDGEGHTFWCFTSDI